MRKKILYVITKATWGGAQQYVYDLATNLPHDQFDIATVGGSNGLLFEKLRTSGIRTISLPALQRDVAFSQEFSAFWQLLKLLRKEKPDIIHLSSSKAAALGALAAFIYKALNPKPSTLNPRIIFTVHGWGFNEDRPLIQRILIFCASWITCLFCDRVVIINTADYATAMRFIPRRKLSLIPHGLMPIEFVTRDEARAFLASAIRHPIPSDTILIGTIAELTKNKGLPYFIEALRLMSAQTTHYKLQTTIIGGGEDYTALTQQIAAAGLQNTIHLLGFIPDAARYLKGLDIFVLPSIKEGLPYALMQAMVAGLPVLATRVGGISDIVTNNLDGLLLPSKNAAALHNAFNILLASPQLRIRIGAAAEKKIKTKFEFCAMIQNTTSLYNDAAQPA